MQYQDMTRTTLATATTLMGAAAAVAADAPAVDKAALDSALEALKTFDWGSDKDALRGIEKAIPATHGSAEARKDLETRLAAVLGTGASRAAKDYVCRKLTIVGTAASVPALAALLADKELSHTARLALERIPGPEAGKTLRDALGTTTGALKAGVIGSLGARQDTESIAALAALVADSDPAIGSAAATALGDIGTRPSSTRRSTRFFR
jgi:HEAT repeat protein